MALVAGVDLTHAFNVPVLHTREVDPIETDDETAGFSVGDEWLNSETGAFFKCGSAKAGEATWGLMVTVEPRERPPEVDPPA